jgi:hypothetical protein
MLGVMTSIARMVALAGTVLAGCGGSARITAHSAAITAPPDCQATFARTLRGVAARVYDQASEGRVVSGSEAHVERSAALAAAVAKQDPAAVRSALKPLLRASIKRIVISGSDGRVLASVGTGAALAPVSGTIAGPAGTPVGRFTLSDTSAPGLAKLIRELTGAQVVMRSGGRMLAADLAGRPATHSTTLSGTAFPGTPLSIQLRTPAPAHVLCGPDDATTAANTIGAVGRRLYRAERGSAATKSVLHIVSHNAAFARAVATDDPAALRAQIVRFFQDPALHVVRIRAVDSRGTLVNDVGGPYVLAPASAPVRLHGRKVGTVTLSIQDDGGYIKLLRRFTGAQVVLRADGLVVPGSTVDPTALPSFGTAYADGRAYRDISYTVSRFPSGPLDVSLLLPSGPA